MVVKIKFNAINVQRVTGYLPFKTNSILLRQQILKFWYGILDLQ
mgnify:CR=1 FL=1